MYTMSLAVNLNNFNHKKCIACLTIKLISNKRVTFTIANSSKRQTHITAIDKLPSLNPIESWMIGIVTVQAFEKKRQRHSMGISSIGGTGCIDVSMSVNPDNTKVIVIH